MTSFYYICWLLAVQVRPGGGNGNAVPDAAPAAGTEEGGGGLALVAVEGTARFEALSFVTDCTFIRNSISAFTRAEIAHCRFVDAGAQGVI